jgi:hypothetical protein
MRLHSLTRLVPGRGVPLLSRAVLLVMASALWSAGPLRGNTILLVDDPLQSPSFEGRFHVSGGSFEDGGWKIIDKDDCIIWHVPRTPTGAIQFDVKGINSRECGPGIQDLTEFFHMYDNTWFNSDFQYGDPGYRDNPFKHFIRKSGAGYFEETSPDHWEFIDCRGHSKTDSMEILWKLCPNNDVSCEDNIAEPDTAVLTWRADTTYHFCQRWEFNGSTTTFRLYRDGEQLLSRTFAGEYACGPGSSEPAPLSLRIGASNRGNKHAGAPVGAVFSNFMAFSGAYSCTCPTPGAPAITSPADGATLNAREAFIQWSGGAHAQYQVQVNALDSPDTSVVWDSGQVDSDRNFAWTGQLADQAGYYAFVRLSNCGNWGAWSAARAFYLDTSAPASSNQVEVQGASLKDAGGPFLGLGASYFQALRRCKFDHGRFISDLDFLKACEFNYVRILSMVGWYPAWQGKEIAPVTFTNQNGAVVNAWSDYWQRFVQCIDEVYERGMRVQVTIFADAQLMPGKQARINHMQTMLAHLAGREHKIILLEVANEAWQNGFPGQQGIADLREFGQYLAERTQIPVALSSPEDTSDAGIAEMYCGSAADIATVHFSRECNVDNGWKPVYDAYRLLPACVPPMNSNEPIGPGASVCAEHDPIKLVMAAAFAWGANLPMYVFHSSAGVFGDVPFESMAGVGSYTHLNNILPADFASWIRHDGIEPSAPFTTLSGAIRHTGAAKGNEFITLPLGIASGGIVLEARRALSLMAYDPLTGALLHSLSKEPGEQFTLPQGPRALILKGVFAESRLCLSDEFSDPERWSGLTPGGLEVNGVMQIIGGATSLYASRAVYCSDPGTGTIRAAVKIRRGTGDATMWGLWFDDPDGYNLARWYGTGTTARGRVGGTTEVTEAQTLTGGWDSLVVRIDPIENTSEFIFNGNSIGTLSHAALGGSDVIGWVQFERIGNAQAAGHSVEFDTLLLGEPIIPADFDDDGDVDHDDFGTFQTCLTGSGQPYSLYCRSADLDNDGDVDQQDLAAFRQCMNGANREPGC